MATNERTQRFLYIYFLVASTCVNACEVSMLVHSQCQMVCACVSVHDAEGLCWCANPQRYFNFCWILKKHAVATALGVPAGELGGCCGCDSGGVEAAHGQGPCRTRWRLFLEDFRTTTLLHQNPANPNHSLLTSFSLSLSL